MSTAAPKNAPAPFTRYQVFVIALLAFLQFTIILDFMILSPLGAALLADLGVTTAQFGVVVSAYAFSAGASGLLAAGFADRFDRKELLLFFYGGFLIGTFVCGVAPSYEVLLVGRMVAGLFGGVIGSIVLAIVADLFALEQRGRVMGFVQTAFAASQVMGLPLGLYLSNLWDWHAPFILIVLVGLVIGVVMVMALRPIDAHLSLTRDTTPLKHLLTAVVDPRYVQAYAVTAFLVTGGFMLMPFGSAFSVHNLGITLEELPLVYMITGISSMIFAPLAGRLADKLGTYPTFVAGSALNVVIVLIYCSLGVTPLWGVIAINVVLFASISARMVGSQTLLSAVPDPKNRGSFMAISASTQQLAGGLASAIAGLVVVQTASGRLEHYERLGFIVASAVSVTVVLMYFIYRGVQQRRAPDATTPRAAA